MIHIRGFGFRLYRKPAFGKPLWFGLILLVLTSLSVVFVVSSRQTINFPYNMYKGLPLTIYDNPYIINNTDCGNHRAVIVVHSAVTNVIKRESIRKTFGNKVLLDNYGTKLVFFLGLPFNKDLQILIVDESLKNSDIVQGNFLDSYTNITHKAVLWLRWINENCPNVQTVLKLDDDVFVNVFSFYNYLPVFEASEKKLWCEVRPVGEQPIQRRAGLKWRVAEHELKGLHYYPVTLCRGYFVILTIDTVRKMYSAARETPFFWIDDFYVFGILANKTGADFSSLKSLAEERDAYKCFASRNSICHLIGVLLESTSAMETFWKCTIQQQNSIS